MTSKIRVMVVGLMLFAGATAHADILAHNAGLGDQVGPSFPAATPAGDLAGLGLAGLYTDFVGVSLFEVASEGFFTVSEFWNADEQTVLALAYGFGPTEPDTDVGIIAKKTIYNDFFGLGTELWEHYTIIIESAVFTESDVDEGGTALHDLGSIVVGEDIVFTTVKGLIADPVVTVEPIMVGGLTTGAILDLDFTADPVEPAEGFLVEFNINTGGLDEIVFADGFFMQEFPFLIPAPGAALLATLGFGCIGWVQRRGRQFRGIHS